MSKEQRVVGSFLEPHPPIVNAWNRHFIKHAKPLVVRKNLVYHMGESDEDETEDTIKVYLRLKPCQDSLNNSLAVLSPRTLLSKAPHCIISRKKFSKHDNCKYTFSHIFEPTVTQKVIFSKCVEKSVEEFLSGKDCLLFSYGTTNAGKTFTVQGNADQPGIIPRIITTIFKSIADKQSNNSRYCPFTKGYVLELNTKYLNEQMELKSKIINWKPDRCQNDSVKSKNACTSVYSIEDTNYTEMQSKLDSEVTGKCIAEENVSFSVWVSFAEIYNEGIYDLLQPPNDKGKRPQLKLTQDSFKNIMIKDLKHVNVTSEAEAHKVLRYGRNNLCFATTGMNSLSSRSHCIFSIKMIKFSDTSDPELLKISSFSICDLAGAERQKNALNVGDRLKESQSINSSLLVLNRCFNVIRENQTRIEKKRVPYRDSKLTQLFQNALNGKESITMVINVNPSDDLYEETQHVLKTSSIAQHIVFEPKPKTSTVSRFSHMISKNNRGTIPWDSSVKSSIAETRTTMSDTTDTREESTNIQEEMEYLLSFVETLQSKLKAEREKSKELKKKNVTLEAELRMELTTQFSQIMQTTRERHEEDLQNVEKFQKSVEGKRIANVKRHYEQELQRMKEKLNVLNASRVNYTEACENEDLKDEISDLEDQVKGLRDLVNVTKEENTKLVQQVTSLNMQYSVLNGENIRLKSILEATKSDGNEKLLTELDSLRTEMAEEIEKRNVQLEDVCDELNFEQGEKNNLEEELSKLKEEYEVNEKKLEDLQSEQEGLNELLDVKNDIIDQLESRIQSLCEESDTIKKERTDCKERLAELMDVCKQKEEDLSKMKLENQNLDKMLSGKDIVIENHKTEIQVAAEKYKDFVELKSVIEEELNSLKNRCEQQEVSIGKVERDQKGLNNQLLEKNETIKELESKLQAMSDNYNTLQEEHSKVLNKKCEVCEKERTVYEKQLSERSQEVTLLEKALKSMLQKNSVLEKEMKEKCDEIIVLQKELKGSVQAVEKEKEFAKLTALKDQEIESFRCKLVAYEHTASVMQSYSEEMEKKNAELSRLRQQTQEQLIFNSTLEQELQSFQSNQKSINARYEEQLRKCKEEIEREKREATTLSNTLYKSTPTPKKELQAEVERLKQDLEAERLSKNVLLEEVSILKARKSSKENVDPNKHLRSKLSVPRASERQLKSKSVSDFTEDSSDNGVFEPKSERKKKTKTVLPVSLRKTRGQKLAAQETSIKVPGFSEDEQEVTQKRGKTRRRLYQRCQDNNEVFDSFEIGQYTRQESPGSALKNMLRSRNKFAKPQ